MSMPTMAGMFPRAPERSSVGYEAGVIVGGSGRSASGALITGRHAAEQGSSHTRLRGLPSPSDD